MTHNQRLVKAGFEIVSALLQKRCKSIMNTTSGGAVNSANLVAPKALTRGFVFIAVILALAAATLPVLAQSGGTGALVGVVSDPTGAVVPGAQVSITNEATGAKRQVESQGNGSYSAPLLQPGTYKVEVSMTGFKAATVKGIRVNVTETARLDVKLNIGSTLEVVTVRSDAEILQTESSTLGRVVESEQVTDLPLVTRNYTDIVTLSPGIAAGVRDASALGSGSGSQNQGGFRANGAFGRDNNFQMDGVPANDLQATGDNSGGIAVPNPDTIQEFKVQTSTYDASYGGAGGANVSVVTKGGSNAFHGTVFEFFRNDALDANSYFRNQTGQNRGVLKQNQFGFALGGPIAKEKLLFFASYQGTRQVDGVGGGTTSSVFTPPFTNDRSRAALGKLFVGQRGMIQNLFGGVGPAIAADGSNISAQAFALLNMKLPNGQFLFPTPQTINTSKPFEQQGFSAFSIPGRFTEDQYMVNLDYLMNAKHSLSLRSFAADGVKNISLSTWADSPVPGFPWLSVPHFRNLSSVETYVVGPKLVNQAIFGFYRTATKVVSTDLFKWSDIGAVMPPDAGSHPSIDINGILETGGIGRGRDSTSESLYRQGFCNLHPRKTHIPVRRQASLTRSLGLADFHFLSGAIFTSWPDLLLGLPAGAAPAGNGTPFSNVYARIDCPGLLDRRWRNTDVNAYGQDNYKLSSTFMLSLGIRFDRLENLSDALGRNSGFDITAADPTPAAGGSIKGYVVSNNFPGTVPTGVKQLDNPYGILGEHQNGFGPRVGLAWQLPHTANRIALRGGYGMFFSRSTGQVIEQMAAGLPFGEGRIVIGLPNAAASIGNVFPPAPAFPDFVPYSPTTQSTLLFLDPHFRAPIAEQYSLNVQADLRWNLLFEAGYIGSRGTHQIIRKSLNQATLASASKPIRGQTTNTLANIPQRVPIEGFVSDQGLLEMESSAASWYNGLESSLTKRLSHGLQFLGAYTFSRCMSTAAVNTLADAGATPPGNQMNPRNQYGRCDFNHEHRFVISYVYEFPKPTRLHSFGNNALGGWAVAGVTTIQQGNWMTLGGTNANNAFGIPGDRAQIVPGCKLSTSSGRMENRLNNYLNSSCVARNSSGAAIWPVIGDDGAATTWGNSGVGIVKGPRQNNSDLSILKRTPIRWMGENG